jgi:hypothetical protein
MGIGDNMDNTVPTNPLLQTLKARIPGETFRLPSQGLFYKNGELSDDVTNGEVHVFPVTTIDEIILKTPDKLMSGRAITEVFERCIPQVKKPMELLSKDVDYLLMCLRLISYGDTLEVTFNHDCKEDSKNHNYSVELRPLISKTRPIDPTIVGSAFSLKLPSDQVVELRPPLYGSVLSLYLSDFETSRLSADERFQQSQEQLLNIIMDTIVTVDGYGERDMIREWIKQIPAGWMQQIGEAMQRIGDWGPSAVIQTVCKDCGEEIELEIPLNPVAFFS